MAERFAVSGYQGVYQKSTSLAPLVQRIKHVTLLVTGLWSVATRLAS